jgi:hypothetical protein
MRRNPKSAIIHLLLQALLRLAELELYTPLWSEEQADRLAAAMRDAFEEADCPGLPAWTTGALTPMP